MPATTTSNSRFTAWLKPEYCGRSTCTIGSPLMGRRWIRGPATSIRRETRMSSVFEFSSSQPRRRIIALPPGRSPATITARVRVRFEVAARSAKSTVGRSMARAFVFLADPASVAPIAR